MQEEEVVEDSPPQQEKIVKERKKSEKKKKSNQKSGGKKKSGKKKKGSGKKKGKQKDPSRENASSEEERVSEKHENIFVESDIEKTEVGSDAVETVESEIVKPEEKTDEVLGEKFEEQTKVGENEEKKLKNIIMETPTIDDADVQSVQEKESPDVGKPLSEDELKKQSSEKISVELDDDHHVEEKYSSDFIEDDKIEDDKVKKNDGKTGQESTEFDATGETKNIDVETPTIDDADMQSVQEKESPDVGKPLSEDELNKQSSEKISVELDDDHHVEEKYSSDFIEDDKMADDKVEQNDENAPEDDQEKPNDFNENDQKNMHPKELPSAKPSESEGVYSFTYIYLFKLQNICRALKHCKLLWFNLQF